MSADEMHAIKLAYPFATLGINVQKPERSQLDETHLELPRDLLFSVFFLYNQLVYFLFPLLPSLFECKRHVPFFVGPRLVQSGISFQIYLCVKRLKRHNKRIPVAVAPGRNNTHQRQRSSD